MCAAFGPFGKKLNFRERTEKFWKWFSDNEETLSALTNSKDVGADAVIRKVSEGLEIIGDVNFNMGGDHEFTFAVHGEDALFYLLPYLVSRMPAE